MHGLSIGMLLYWPDGGRSMKSIAMSIIITAILVNTGCVTAPENTLQKDDRSGKHLFILSGQSNMAGIDPGVSFTPTVTNALGGQNIIIVKHAVGGSSIRDWCKRNLEKTPPTAGVVPKVRGRHYDALLVKIRAAEAQDKFKTVTLVWMQGESDKRNPEYHAYLTELIRQFQSDLHIKDINVVIGRISDAGLYPEKPLEGKHKLMFEGAKTIRRTQVEFAESYPRGVWVDTDDLNNRKQGDTMVNDLHYTPEGYKILGQRFAEKAIELITKGTQESR